MYIRPSKNFLFPFLKKELSAMTGEVGVDAASAGMKNRHMFKTNLYVGLDINMTLLEAGLEKYKNVQTVGIHADIANLKGIPENSVNVTVSTNTLYALSAEKRLSAIDELSRITSPAGNLVCEMLLTDNFDTELAFLEKNFKSVKKRYYKNAISRVYENLFEQNGNLGSHPVAGLLPFRIFSWLLSRLEFLTMHFPNLNRQALLICKNKKTTDPKQVFSLEKAKKISDRLYSLM